MSVPGNYHEIYRGYDIDYHIDHENVYILKDRVKVAEVGGVEDAYRWIDAKRKEENSRGR